MQDPQGRRLTSKDIARHAGVSQTTVSLVLRGAAAGRVSVKTQEHVREVARTLGYQPSRSARSLRSGRAHMLGLLIPNVTDPFFAEVLRGAQEIAAERGYTVALVESTAARAREAVAATEATLLDGIVLHSPGRRELSSVRAISERLVVIDGGAPRGLSWVRYDHAESTRLLVEHLEGLGHSRIAHVQSDVDKPTFAERAREIARRAGDHLVAAVQVPFEFDAGRSRIERFLRDERAGATALICDNDSLAAMAFAAARRSAIAMPDQLSLAGINDTALAQALELTTVSVPAAEAGRVGTQMLFDRFAGVSPVNEILPVALIERASTSPPS